MAIHCNPPGWLRKTSRNITQYQHADISNTKQMRYHDCTARNNCRQNFNRNILQIGHFDNAVQQTANIQIHFAPHREHSVPYKDQWLTALSKTRTVYFNYVTEHITALTALHETFPARLDNFRVFLWTGSTEEQNHTDWYHSTVNLILHYRQI
jgi:hypothetical protein